jgi:phosphatidylglycerophosphatase A
VTPAKLLATWFGVGLVPKAPGTFGSLAALPLAWLIERYWNHAGLLAVSMLIFAIGVIACDRYVRESGRKDPKEAVIDEVAGQCFLLAVLPCSWKSYVIGFVLFRFFDIVKPFPVSYFDRNVSGGLGVMLDDIAAASYPILLLLAAAWCGVNIDTVYNWLM